MNIPDFKFNNPTINLELNFIPDNNFKTYSIFMHYKLNGNVKKLTQYYVYDGDSDKRFEKMNSNALYNKDALITMVWESEEIKMNYYYDANRLIQYERIVRKDTFFIKKIKYNSNNQIIEISQRSNRGGKINTHKHLIEYNNNNRPSIIYYVGSDGKKEKRKALTYYNNTVIYHEYYSGKEINVKKFTYSKNGYLIKSYNTSSNYSVFYSYNEKGYRIKTITFIGGKLINIRTYSYDKYGNRLISIFKLANTKGEEITTHIFQYDKQGNMVYDTYSSNVSNRVHKIKYVLDYY